MKWFRIHRKPVKSPAPAGDTGAENATEVMTPVTMPPAETVGLGGKPKMAGITQWRNGRRNPNGSKGSQTQNLLLGLPLPGSESWVRVFPDGRCEEVREFQGASRVVTAKPGDVIFRGLAIDHGQRFSNKLRGKSLKNVMLRTLEAMPVARKLDGVTWFTEMERAVHGNHPVHSFGAALWMFAKKQKWHPDNGLLLRLSFPMGESTLWVFVALGHQGQGPIQTARTDAESERPIYSVQALSGILNDRFRTEDVDLGALTQFLLQEKPGRYPQPDEWGGIPKSSVGKLALIAGGAVLVSGAAAFFWTGSMLEQAKHDAQILSSETRAVIQGQHQFYLRHIQGIVALQAIPLHQDLADTMLLWKPGTTAALYDGMPLEMGGQSGPAIPRPGQSGNASASHGASFVISIPAVRSVGSGQTFWVSNPLLKAVLDQSPPAGITLNSVNPVLGGQGYVAIFGRK